MIKDKYESYRQALLAGGADPKVVEQIVAEARAEGEKIDACVCPKCRSRLTRVLDRRQAGPTEIAGKWFNYRYTECPYFVDRCEPVGEN